jgi:tetratricopeptide (TPR) repeat protein
MTVGERRPATHSTMLGWQIDWADLSVSPVAERPSRRTETAAGARPNWEQALQHYVEACISATRPRDANGAFLNRDPSLDELLCDYRTALAHLDRAIELALADGVEEVPFRYMRARLRHSAEDYAGSAEDWTVLLEIWDAQKAGRRPSLAGQPSRIHDFEAALILILSAVAADKVHGNLKWTGRGERFAEARMLLRKLRAAHFPGGRAVHRDLRDWEKRLARIEAKGGGAVELPEDNFITVE